MTLFECIADVDEHAVRSIFKALQDDFASNKLVTCREDGYQGRVTSITNLRNAQKRALSRWDVGCHVWGSTGKSEVSFQAKPSGKISTRGSFDDDRDETKLKGSLSRTLQCHEHVE